MKLRNKKTGEIIDDGYVRETHDFQFDGQKHVLAVFKGNGHRPPERVSGAYASLAELNEEWEDYDEPKEYWWIDYGGRIKAMNDSDDEEDKARKQIGNYFETKEEAEKAVEKLKAWKRLKDKGYRVMMNNHVDGMLYLRIWNDTTDEPTPLDKNNETFKDLNLLFGGEE